MALNERDVDGFWKWFVEHRDQLGRRDLPDSLVRELENRIFSLHELDWEIGPGQHAPNMFCLSPSGEKDLLQITQQIVKRAPDLNDWEIHSAKPARKWDLVFNLAVDSRNVEMDGKQWEFVVYKFNDGTYDLLFKPEKKNEELSDEYLNWAATIIADGELGEETRMSLIGQVEVVKSWDARSMHAARKVEPGLLARLLGQRH